MGLGREFFEHKKKSGRKRRDSAHFGSVVTANTAGGGVKFHTALEFQSLLMSCNSMAMEFQSPGIPEPPHVM